jgi:hypothetical protein
MNGPERGGLGRRSLLAGGIAVMAVAVAVGGGAARAQAVTPDEARAIAKEAYIYGFPMVDSYRVQHAYFVDEANPEYKAPWNRLKNV